MPADVDVARTKANFEQGMVEIEAPKAKHKRPAGKKIKVSAKGR
ncbi:MAG: Hsp20/alpha crystallin family protein [Woeseiaceae bacterium]|nr:Hsp20/alpha crystallin family protein [Woeseiaceae bacterium]